MNIEVNLEYKSVKRCRIEYDKQGLRVIVPKHYRGNIAELIKRHQKWIIKRKSIIDTLQNNPLPTVNRTERELYDLIDTHINESAGMVNKQPTIVKYRKMKTRWGSCSSKGRITFNKRLIFLPSELVGYVVHHELAHLIHMNHGERFWSLVGQKYPNYKTLKRQLLLYGLHLN